MPKSSYSTLKNYEQHKPTQKEKFGGFSISAAVRRPYHPSRDNKDYKQPKYIGVS